MRTFKLTEDNGRDVNLANATNQALNLFLDFLKETLSHQELDSKE